MSSIRMWLACGAQQLSTLTAANIISYTGGALLDMQRNGSGVEHIMKSSEARTWFTSIFAFGALLGAMVAGPLSNTFGRKITTIVQCFPSSVGWLFIAFGKTYSLLLLGRWLTGISVGMIFTVIPVYCIEISTPSLRGAFGVIFSVFLTGGYVCTTALAVCFPWNVNAVIFAVAPVVCATAVLLVVPESPKWLVGRGYLLEAEKAMKILYTDKIDTQKEINIMVSQLGSERTGGVKWTEYKAKSVWKPSLFVVFLCLVQQFSGAVTIMVYSASIFKAAGVFSIPPIYCAIIIQATQFMSTIVLGIKVDKVGRRPMLIFSLIGMALVLSAFSAYSYVNEVNPSAVKLLRWFPLVCLFFFNIVFEAGLGPLAWMLAAELIPVRVRGVISSAATFASLLGFFAVCKFYDMGIDLLSTGGLFLVYAGLDALTCAIVWFFLPETKGKSIEEIEQYFENGSIKNKVATGS